MGCQVCSNRTDIKLDKIPNNENALSIRNLNYLSINKQKHNNNKIMLNKGKIFFENCKSFFSKKKPISEFILLNELTFPFPIHSEFDFIDEENSNFINENYLTLTLKKIKKELNDKNLELVNFHYDIMNSNVELSVLLQFVDDTNSLFQRRNNLLSKISKYIGINIGKIENGLYCYYLLFGKDSSKHN